MKRNSKGAPAFVILSVVLVLAIAAGAVILALSSPGRALGQRVAALREEFSGGVTMTLADGVFSPQSGDFTVTDERGKSGSFQLEASQQGAALSGSLTLAPSFTPAPQTVAYTVTRGEEPVFEGSDGDLKSFVPTEDDGYVLTATAQYVGADYTGSCRFVVALSFDAPPSFSLSAPSVAQGDTLMLSGHNIRIQDVSVSVSYSYEPVVLYSGTDCYSLLPFNYVREPGDYTATVTYRGTEYPLPYTVTETDFPVQYLTVDSATTAATVDSAAANEEYAEIIPPLLDHFDPTIYWEGDFIQPVSGTITTEYGIKRYTNGSTYAVRHSGIDIANAEGTPIAAGNSGVILYSGYLQLSGNTILIDHGGGVTALYLHMSERYVETGGIVTKGDVIGAVGTTGYSTGPHLHYAMYLGGHAISPWSAFDGTAGFYQLKEAMREEA